MTRRLDIKERQTNDEHSVDADLDFICGRRAKKAQETIWEKQQEQAQAAEVQSKNKQALCSSAHIFKLRCPRIEGVERLS
jgi:hypothetical protein